MFKRLNYTEPAVLRGIVLAALGLAAAVGFTVPDDAPQHAEKILGAIAILTPIVQAVWTRMAVWSPKTHVDQLARAAGHVDTRTPGYPAHADPED